MNDFSSNFDVYKVFKSLLTFGERTRASLAEGEILAQGIARGSMVFCCVAWDKNNTWIESLCGQIGLSVPIEINVPEWLQKFAQHLQAKLQENGYRRVVVNLKKGAPPAKPRKRKEKAK